MANAQDDQVKLMKAHRGLFIGRTLFLIFLIGSYNDLGVFKMFLVFYIAYETIMNGLSALVIYGNIKKAEKDTRLEQMAQELAQAKSQIEILKNSKNSSQESTNQESTKIPPYEIHDVKI